MQEEGNFSSPCIPLHLSLMCVFFFVLLLLVWEYTGNEYPKFLSCLILRLKQPGERDCALQISDSLDSLAHVRFFYALTMNEDILIKCIQINFHLTLTSLSRLLLANVNQ